ncbi:RedY protein [Roseateles sp. DAIF2]|uniref:RedY protein n=1 Tax=Roseateles sp. DAIF2 TaxID=2714952 RepID=UPI0018A32F5D|nr:RedY protein [Roseateles sp. DAIF2]QPF73604.1 RedY protein [Roseateles sp. DAIF2]
MLTLIDRIRLKSPEQRAPFMRWVREVDYRACQDLPSVLRFQVFECPGGDGLDFFEIVEVSSAEAFDLDMRTPLFQTLVQRFSQMAELGDQFGGHLLEPGFERQR